jgi:hypothetical protein
MRWNLCQADLHYSASRISSYSCFLLISQCVASFCDSVLHRIVIKMWCGFHYATEQLCVIYVHFSVANMNKPTV